MLHGKWWGVSVPQNRVTTHKLQRKQWGVSPERSVPKDIATPAIGFGFLRTRRAKAHLGIGM